MFVVKGRNIIVFFFLKIKASKVTAVWGCYSILCVCVCEQDCDVTFMMTFLAEGGWCCSTTLLVAVLCCWSCGCLDCVGGVGSTGAGGEYGVW